MKERNVFYDGLLGWIIVIILAALGMYLSTGCELVAPISQDWIHHEVIPNDTVIVPIDTIPTDTIPEPIVLDTCDEYHDIVSTKFSTWAVNLDGIIPGHYEFYYRSNGPFIPIDIDSFLNQYGVSTTYYSGINICGIVTGLDNPSFAINHNLYTFDLFGNIFQITLRPYNLDMQGALTFDQLFALWVQQSNFHRAGFFNCGNFDCDQVNTLLDYLIDNCINGQGDKIDLRFATCQDQDRIGLLELAHFTVIQ